MKIQVAAFFSILCAYAFGISARQLDAATQSFHSGVERNTVIELYTSEGCSSCPPADRWLSRLKQDQRLWNDVIPIAFHVDYWDYIGWKDRFAKPEYSQRQRGYAREYQENTVYTPGLKVNGYPWLSWRRDGLSVLDSPSETAGNLSLSVDDNGGFTAQFEPEISASSLTLNIAVLGMNLVSQVQRGENKGKELRHDFVVLAHQSFNSMSFESEASNPQDVDSTPSRLSWQGSLPSHTTVADKFAIVAWVANDGALSPVQAVAGYLE